MKQDNYDFQETSEVSEKKSIKGDENGHINFRCLPGEKDYVMERAKDGFGQGRTTITNLMHYAIAHMDDTSPVNLREADSLLKAIGENRPVLSSVHADINAVSNELSRIGNNVNQIARQVNTVMKVAREDGEVPSITLNKVLNFESTLIGYLSEIRSKMMEFNTIMRTSRKRINDALLGEDDIITRCLIHPKVGNKARHYSELLRMIQSYQNERKATDRWTLDVLKNCLEYDIRNANEEFIKSKEE